MKILKKKGFTLVEIMIVVAVIALLAAIAIPNLLRARLNANEGAAISNLHTLTTAMASYQINQIPPNYPPNLAILGSVGPPYIDTVLASGTKQGYDFAYTRDSAYAYRIVATPCIAGKTGKRSFFVDDSGVIRVGTTASGIPLG